jgi:hypothetical protein
MIRKMLVLRKRSLKLIRGRRLEDDHRRVLRLTVA